jgi:hypothetical protein
VRSVKVIFKSLDLLRDRRGGEGVDIIHNLLKLAVKSMCECTPIPL